MDFGIRLCFAVYRTRLLFVCTRRSALLSVATINILSVNYFHASRRVHVEHFRRSDSKLLYIDCAGEGVKAGWFVKVKANRDIMSQRLGGFVALQRGIG